MTVRDGFAAVCAADVVPGPVRWLWRGRLAAGKQTCLAGEPGAGKSQVALHMAATISTGGDWPVGEGRAPQGSVIVLAAEDGVADTVVPRLLAAGADLSRVHIITAARTDGRRRAVDLGQDISRLERMIREIGDVALVAIDPISSYLGRIDSHRNTDVRGVLDPLAEMADRTGVAILAVTHVSKGGATKALYRVIGSVAFVAAARMAFVVVEDAAHPGRRLLLPTKNNLAAHPQGLAYRVEQVVVAEDIVASRVAYESAPVTVTADEALAAEVAAIGERTAKAEAMDLLRDLLADGPMPAAEIERIAEDYGLSAKALRSARQALGVEVRREGFGPGSHSLWLWPGAHTCPRPS